MTTMEISQDAKKEFTVQYYIVAFIDLLGQQDALKKFDHLPDKSNPQVMEKFYATVKGTFGVVRQLRRCFDNFFTSYLGHSANICNLSAEQEKAYRQMKGNEVKFQRFSDLFVIFASLKDDINKLPIESIYATIGACASTFLLMMSVGHLMRGGIEVGLGAEMFEGEIYGPVVSSVYALESKVAQYPRIVIGQELWNYLRVTLDSQQSDIYSKAAKKFATTCVGMLAQDIDGVPFVDYLGEGFRKDIAAKLDKKVPQDAYSYLLERSAEAEKRNDTKSAFRFSLLLNYFEERLHLWGDDIHPQNDGAKKMSQFYRPKIKKRDALDMALKEVTRRP